MTEMIARELTVNIGSACLLKSASIRIRRGELVAILGPNGAGKTTLLRAMMGMVPVTSGSVSLNGENCFAMSFAARARYVSYLPQIRPLAWPLSVRDVVSLGRFAHGVALGKLQNTDYKAVESAIAACDLEALANRATDTLSGGEIARVHLARAIAAGAPLLVADEPTAALDPRHQLRIADLLRKFVDDGGGALVVLHDVSLAARIADRLIWAVDGKVIADGTPAETLSTEMMADVYGVRAQIIDANDRLDVRLEGVI